MNPNPLTVKTYPNAFFVPAGIVSYEDLVYDEDGALVEASATWRRMSGGWISNPPRTLPTLLRHQGDAMRLSGDHLFLGRFNESHYGHWLTEGVARLWVLLPGTDTTADNRYRVITSARMTSLKERLRPWIKPQSCQWHAALGAFGLKSDRFTVVQRAVRAAQITVPEPSMMNEESLYPEHLTVCREIGRHVTQGQSFPSPSSQAVYLSRVGLSRRGLRTYAGEEALEAELRRLGVRVVRPETLGLREQVVLFTIHSTFIGTWGSAFHTLLLRQADNAVACLYLIDKHWTDAELAVRTNFSLIDALMGNRVHWVRSLSPDPTGGLIGKLDEAATVKVLCPLVAGLGH